MYRHTEILWTLIIGLACMLVVAGASRANESPVTAIDIAIEPDATMIQHAQSANAKMLTVYPKGFTLDASHHPHISVLQRFVNTADLDKVYLAANTALAREKPDKWRFRAFKYYFIPDGKIGLAGIVIKPTPDLLKLQKNLTDAVAPFTAETGTAAAFVTTPEQPEINQPTIDYVASFVAKETGNAYNPHVTTGMCTVEYLKTLLAKPFNEFSFGQSGATIYQLGNYGTAQKTLKVLDFPSKNQHFIEG